MEVVRFHQKNCFSCYFLGPFCVCFERLDTNARDFKVTQGNLVSSFVLLNNFYVQLLKLTYENTYLCQSV